LGVWRSYDALGAILAAPDFVIIGHVTLDRFGEVTRPGGAVLYAAVAAHRLGLSVGLLTSHGDDFPLDAIPTRIEAVSVPARETARLGVAALPAEPGPGALPLARGRARPGGHRGRVAPARADRRPHGRPRRRAALRQRRPLRGAAATHDGGGPDGRGRRLRRDVPRRVPALGRSLARGGRRGLRGLALRRGRGLDGGPRPDSPRCGAQGVRGE